MEGAEECELLCQKWGREKRIDRIDDLVWEGCG